MRKLHRSVADASGITSIVPVELGGFGSTSAEEAAANIAAASSFTYGLPNGLAQLDAQGKVKVDQLPGQTISHATLSGPRKVNPGERVQYEITNWISGKDYIVSCSKGTVARTANIITYEAPQEFGIVSMTVDGRSVNIEVTAIIRDFPEIFIHEVGDSKVSGNIISTAKDTSNYFVEISTSSDFSKASTILVPGTEAAFTSDELIPGEHYYFRARCISANGSLSEWSIVKDLKLSPRNSGTLRLVQLLTGVKSAVSDSAIAFPSATEFTYSQNYGTDSVLFENKDGAWQLRRITSNTFGYNPGKNQRSTIIGTSKKIVTINYQTSALTSIEIRVTDLDNQVLATKIITVTNNQFPAPEVTVHRIGNLDQFATYSTNDAILRFFSYENGTIIEKGSFSITGTASAYSDASLSVSADGLTVVAPEYYVNTSSRCRVFSRPSITSNFERYSDVSLPGWSPGASTCFAGQNTNFIALTLSTSVGTFIGGALLNRVFLTIAHETKTVSATTIKIADLNSDFTPVSFRPIQPGSTPGTFYIAYGSSFNIYEDYVLKESLSRSILATGNPLVLLDKYRVLMKNSLLAEIYRK